MAPREVVLKRGDAWMRPDDGLTILLKEPSQEYPNYWKVVVVRDSGRAVGRGPGRAITNSLYKDHYILNCMIPVTLHNKDRLL